MQKIEGPTMPLFGAQVCVRHAPTAPLCKLQSRAAPCAYLHKSTHTPGTSYVGLLQKERMIRVSAKRRKAMAALTASSLWKFPGVLSAQLGRATAHGQGRAQSATCSVLVSEDDVPLGDQVDGLDALLLSDNYDAPYGELIGDQVKGLGVLRRPEAENERNGAQRAVQPGTYAAQRAARSVHTGASTAAEDRPSNSALVGPAKGAREELASSVDDDSKRARDDPERTCRMDTDDAQQRWGRDQGGAWPQVFGLATRTVPLRTDEAKGPEAQAAVNKVNKSAVDKGVFGPTKLHAWPEARRRDRCVTVGAAIIIIGRSSSRREEEYFAQNGRPAPH